MSERTSAGQVALVTGASRGTAMRSRWPSRQGMKVIGTSTPKPARHGDRGADGFRIAAVWF